MHLSCLGQEPVGSWRRAGCPLTLARICLRLNIVFFLRKAFELFLKCQMLMIWPGGPLIIS